MLLIVAFFAPKYSGKTTSASILEKILREEYGYIGEITRLSFSTMYKDVASVLGFNLSEKEIVDNELGLSPREFLKLLGDYFRVTLPLLTERKWLNGSSESASTYVVRKELEEMKTGIVIIDDLRYVEEYEMLCKFKSVFIYIRRPSIPMDVSVHSSEKELFRILERLPDAAGSSIQNTGSQEDLTRAIDTWFKKMMIKFLFESQ